MTTRGRVLFSLGLLGVAAMACGGGTALSVADASTDAAVDGGSEATSDGGRDAEKSPPSKPCVTSDDCADVTCACRDGGFETLKNTCTDAGSCVAFPVCPLC